MSLLCTAGALFLDVRSLAVEQIPIGFDGQGLALLVIDTRARHELADGEYEARRRSCEDAARELGVGTLREVSTQGLGETLARLSSEMLRMRVRHVVTENARVLEAVSALRNGSPSELGAILNASHASLQDDFQVSSPELDLAVESSIAASALGARMTGAGFGGCAIALVEEEQRQSILEAVSAAFRHEGFASPHAFTASAVDGARRLT